jgi:hypothetical protein
MSENQKTATKRKFLKGIGAAAVGTAGVAASTGGAAADDFDYSVDLSIVYEGSNYYVPKIATEVEGFAGFLNDMGISASVTETEYAFDSSDAPDLGKSNIGDEWADFVKSEIPTEDDAQKATLLVGEFGDLNPFGRTPNDPNNGTEWDNDYIGGSVSILNLSAINALIDGARPAIAVHELCHAFGAEHYDGTFDVFNPTEDGEFQPSVLGAAYVNDQSGPYPDYDFRGYSWTTTNEFGNIKYQSILSEDTVENIDSTFDGGSIDNVDYDIYEGYGFLYSYDGYNGVGDSTQ